MLKKSGNITLVLGLLLVLSACGDSSATPVAPPFSPTPTNSPAHPSVLPPTSTTTTSVPTSNLATATPAVSSSITFTITSRLTAPGSEPTTLAWSPDGTLLATCSGGFSSSFASDDKAVRIWKADGTLLATLSGHSGAITSLAWSPDGKILASGSFDGSVRLWNAGGTNLATLDTKAGKVMSLAWSPDGNTLAVGIVASPKDNKVQLWSPKESNLLETLVTDYSGGKFYNLGWSPDGKYLVGGATDYKLWKADGTEVYHATSCASCTPAWGLAWSPDSRLWAYGNESGTIAIYTNEGKAVTSLRSPNTADSLAWSPDGKILAGAGRGVSLWQIDSSKDEPPSLIVLAQNSASQIASLAWSPDGKILAAGSARNYAYAASPTDNYIQLLDRQGNLLATLTGHTNQLNSLSWSPKGDLLASASKDGSVLLWKKGP